MQILREYEVVDGRNEPWWKIVFWWGAFHGALRAFLGTLLYVFIYAECIDNWSIFSQHYELGDILFALAVGMYIIFAIMAYVFIPFVLAPSALGGGVVAWILLALKRNHELYPKESLVVGCLVGGAAGFAVIGLIHQVITGGGFVELWPSIVGAAILVGAWHSWRTARWLSYRTQSQPKNQTVSEDENRGTSCEAADGE